MKRETMIANALDGISKAFYATKENGTSVLLMEIHVQYNCSVPGSVLDIAQDHLIGMYRDIWDALQTCGEDSA